MSSIIVSATSSKLRELEAMLERAMEHAQDVAVVPISPTMGFLGVLYSAQTEEACLRNAVMIAHVQVPPSVHGGPAGMALVIDSIVGSRKGLVEVLSLPRDHTFYRLDALSDADRLTVLELYYAAIKQAADRS